MATDEDANTLPMTKYRLLHLIKEIVEAEPTAFTATHWHTIFHKMAHSNMDREFLWNSVKEKTQSLMSENNRLFIHPEEQTTQLLQHPNLQGLLM